MSCFILDKTFPILLVTKILELPPETFAAVFLAPIILAVILSIIGLKIRKSSRVNPK